MGKKGPNVVYKLEKETRDRHFPEYNGGKGSHPRKSTPVTRDRFKLNYDSINWEYTGKSFIKSSN